MEEKSLYDISWKVSEEEYRADPAYSYSTIARFNREGFNNLDKLFDKLETPSLLFGSLVDTLLTDGQEEFDRRFEVADFPPLSDTLVQITRYLFNNFGNKYRDINSIPDNIVAQIGEENNYYANSKYASYRVKKIKEECSEYYNLLFLSVDKTLVSTTDYQDAVNCVDVLKTNPTTKWYFEENNPFDDVQRFYQLKFKGEYEGIPLRVMADLLIVDRKNKVIIPCDLKTSSKKECDFYKSFMEYNYFIQSQLYWYIIRQNLDKDPIFKDYKLLDYRFIVINRYNLKPLVWEYEHTQCAVDINYGDNKYYCKNWRSIVKELDYYLKDRADYPMDIKTNEPNSLIKWLTKD